MEIITGVDLSNNSLSKALAKEVALKKGNRLKENGSISVLGLVNKPFVKDLKYRDTNK
jgi:transposase